MERGSAINALAKGKTTYPVVELMDTCRIFFLGNWHPHGIRQSRHLGLSTGANAGEAESGRKA